MCHYGTTQDINTDRVLRSVQKALSKKEHYDVLVMSPLGSIFDPYELPPEARRCVFEFAAATDCTSFGCETRPELLTEDAVAEFAAVLENKSKQVNIGLESSNPWILRNCIGKSCSPNDFAAGATLLQHYGIRPIANILLGAPFLTEREALDSTIQSVRWALENGAHICVLFPSNVKRWTLQYWLWERGLYHSPSLWSLVEVIYALGPELSQRIALSYYNRKLSTVIKEIPHTCQDCHQDVVEVLGEYCARGDFSLIETLRQSTCACRAEWRAKILAQSSLPLYHRVVKLYERIACDLLGPDWWEESRNSILNQLAEDYECTELENSEMWSLE